MKLVSRIPFYMITLHSVICTLCEGERERDIEREEKEREKEERERERLETREPIEPITPTISLFTNSKLTLIYKHIHMNT